jgi:predicted transcriptional regulator of viral defense system
MEKNIAIKILSNEKKIYTRSELLIKNINDNMIRTLINDGFLHRIKNGLYSTDQAETDTEFLLQLKYSKCIISHESALYHHGYSDRIPENISVTIPERFGTSRFKDQNLKIRYCKPDLLQYGTQESESIYGNSITIYNLERTICDVIRHYSSIDIEIANKAIRKYCLENPKKISVLMLYAKKMGITEKVRNKLEVLL